MTVTDKPAEEKSAVMRRRILVLVPLAAFVALASIFAVGNNSVFLDAETKTQIALGDPKRLLAGCPDPRVQQFLKRGEPADAESTRADRGL